MARRPRRDEDEPDDGPSESDIERFSDVTRRCPSCNCEVYDEAELCWKCGHAFTRRDTGMPPKWVVIVTIALVVGIVYFYVRGMF
ncbi:MAG: hypothetical protein ACOYN0_17335 [Phycisphaerales bacterium]